MIEPRIETIEGKKMIGRKMRISLGNNKTSELWRSFMPLRKEIKNNIGDELYSLQVYEKSFNFIDFTFDTQFEKWAAAEVSDFNTIPPGMEAFELPGGKYAVFLHKGDLAKGVETFTYIFKTWLPLSGYVADSRPHFEILGKKYKNNDPDSEEEIWIPIRLKD